jgi:transcriptional regulator of heat shock response
MSPRIPDYQQRKDLILGIVVEEYIKIVSPISSQFISRKYPVDLSSATVRNILAELEEDGYLTHPHISAGRMPTQSGYRYYVDHLMNEIKLLEEEQRRIRNEYKRQVLELETLLEKISQVISDITHYTSIVSMDGNAERLIYHGTSHIVNYPEANDIQRIQAILLALEEKDRIIEIINRDLQNKVQIYIGQELSCSEINECSMVVSRYQVSNGSSGRIAILGPTRMNYGKVRSALEYLTSLMSELL